MLSRTQRPVPQGLHTGNSLLSQHIQAIFTVLPPSQCYFDTLIASSKCFFLYLNVQCVPPTVLQLAEISYITKIVKTEIEIKYYKNSFLALIHNEIVNCI